MDGSGRGNVGVVEPTPEALAAWRAFIETHALLFDVLSDEHLRETGMPLTWREVLYFLWSAPGQALRMQDLSRRLLISKAGLSRRFTRMEEAGLVARRPCPDDLRGTLATLTPAGVAAFERVRPVHLDGVQRHFAAPLTEAELRTLTSALVKVRDALA